MSEILITGLEMLPEGFAYDVRIRGNGDVVDRLTGVVMGKAIEVPPHGELCDKDKLKEEAGGTYQWSQAIEAIKNAPVILEATE